MRLERQSRVNSIFFNTSTNEYIPGDLVYSDGTLYKITGECTGSNFASHSTPLASKLNVDWDTFNIRYNEMFQYRGEIAPGPLDLATYIHNGTYVFQPYGGSQKVTFNGMEFNQVRLNVTNSGMMYTMIFVTDVCNFIVSYNAINRNYTINMIDYIRNATNMTQLTPFHRALDSIFTLSNWIKTEVKDRVNMSPQFFRGTSTNIADIHQKYQGSTVMISYKDRSETKVRSHSLYLQLENDIDPVVESVTQMGGYLRVKLRGNNIFVSYVIMARYESIR